MLNLFAQPRPGPALPLSIALHIVLIYSVTRVPWVVEEVRSRSPTSVVWLNDWRPTEDKREAVPAPTGAPDESQAVPVEPPISVREPAPDERPPAPELPVDDAEPASPATAPAVADRQRSYFAPGVDWEKERQQAAARVLEQREREEAYATFSLDDVVEDHPREEPSPPTNIAEAIADPCHVASGAIQRFALRMIGRCVREARGDLFADIKPAYLRNRPVCAETRAGQPPVMDARGNPISTVKCRLVDEDEYEAISTTE